MVALSQLHSGELLSANLIRHAVRRLILRADRAITDRATHSYRAECLLISEQFRIISYDAAARQYRSNVDASGFHSETYFSGIITAVVQSIALLLVQQGSWAVFSYHNDDD